MIGSASCTRPLHQALIPLAVTVPSAAYFISGRARSQMEEELDTQPAIERQKPPSIDLLFRKTKFSRSEIQRLYRMFKELWPNGTVDLCQFQSIYENIFPKGNSKAYAELVFRNIDRKNVGAVTFLDFVTNFSTIAKGDLNEKLNWIFSLYDSNSCGSIGYNDIYNVVSAMYQLVNSSLKPGILSSICRQHVKMVFKRLNVQHESRLCREEFLRKCYENAEIMKSFDIFASYTGGLITVSQ